MDSVISEDTSLGACWAMSGDAGHVTIELSKEITVLAVAFEHVSRMVTPESFSAPAEFQVGLPFILQSDVSAVVAIS